jgi:hypothetical protein
MGLPASTPIFVLGNRTFDWADLQDAARAWGDLQRVERRIREGLASLRFLEADESELEPDAIEAAAEEFRHEHNLLAAEEMSGWLEDRGLEVEDWLAFIERSLARRVCAADLDEIVAGYPVEDGEISAAGDCEAICSGTIAGTARKLAAAASFAAARDLRDAGVAELRVAFDELCAAALTPTAVERMVATRLLEWTAFDCHLASFPDEDSAREAIFCVRDERLALSEVARVAGAREERGTFYLDDLEPDAQARLLSAEKGSLLGPVAFRGHPTVVLLVDKTPPTLGDPELRARAEKAVVAAAIERAARAARFLLEL